MKNVGIVSMGNMGTTIAKSVKNSGNIVHWTSESRSQNTVDNARKITGAIEHPTLSSLFDSSDIVFCIGRLGAGLETMRSAVEHGFNGIYIDGNNLYGEESELEINKIANSGNIDYVEALFRGFPLGYDQGGGEDKRDLYISGQLQSTDIVASLFSDGVWKVHVVPESAKALNRTMFKRLF